MVEIEKLIDERSNKASIGEIEELKGYMISRDGEWSGHTSYNQTC